MSTPTSPAETQRLAKLVRERAGQENAAKAKAANRLISKCLIFIEYLHPDAEEKRQAAQWFLQSVENAAREDLQLAMAYAYNSYAGGKRTLYRRDPQQEGPLKRGSCSSSEGSS